MPVLPEFQPARADAVERFDQSLRTYEGMLDRSRQRQEEVKVAEFAEFQRNALRPVIAAKAQADLAEASLQFSRASDEQLLRSNLAETEIEASSSFHSLTNVDPLYANDPSMRETLATQREEGFINFLADFGAYEKMSPGIAAKLNFAKEELANISQAREYVRQQQARNRIDEQEKLAAQQTRLAATEDFLKRTVPNFQWNTPVPLPGNAGKAVLYRPTPDGSYTTDVVDTVDRTPQGMTIETRPDGSTVITQGGPGLTPTTKGRLQQDAINLDRSLVQGYDLLNNLTQASVGVTGTLQEFANKTLPQVGAAGVFDSQVASTRNKIRLFNESVMKMLTSDTRFTDADARRIKQMLPDPGALESLPNAQQRIRDIIQSLETRASLYNRELGRPDLINMTPEEIRDAVQADPSLFPLAEEVLRTKHGYD